MGSRPNEFKAPIPERSLAVTYTYCLSQMLVPSLISSAVGSVGVEVGAAVGGDGPMGVGEMAIPDTSSKVSTSRQRHFRTSVHGPVLIAFQ